MKKILFAIVILSMATAAFSYTLNGRKWFSTATFKYNAANGPSCCLSTSQRESQITSGITPWGILKYGGYTSASGARNDGVNAVSWGKLGGTTLGVTNYVTTDTSQYQNCNGNLLYKFVEVDVRFNNATSWKTSSGCTNGYDLQGVSTHEFGHAAGLGHSSVASSTMYYAVAACDFSKSSLDTDDKNGYNAVYNCGGRK